MATFEDRESLSSVRSKINDAIVTLEGTNSFSRVSVAGQGNVDADGKNSTLNLEAGSNITITTNASTDTVTISSTGGAGVTDGDKGDITVTGSGTVWTIDDGAVNLATKVSGTLPATSFDDTAHGSRAGGTLHAAATTSVAGFMSGADKTKLNGIATGANLYVHPNHTGDVTSVADGATTIAANAVTNAKLAQAVANTLKGNNTGSTANVADLTTSQVKTMLAITTADVSGISNYLTKTETYNAGHAPEGQNLANAFLLNDFANARLRGSTFISTNTTLTNAQIDGLVDGKGTYLSFNTLTQTFPIVIEFNLPRVLAYGAYVGVSFGFVNWRARGVKIETFTEGAWITLLNTTTNAVADIIVPITGNAAAGTSSVRYTFSDPATLSTSGFRILHLWGYNYNSDMWSQAIMPRVGGSFYGAISAPSLTLTTDLAIADGGTGASDAATARTNLGLGTLATQSGTFSGTSSGTNTGDQNIFQNIAVSGQTTVVADTTTDTLTLAAGTGIGITTNATTDTITITNSAPDQTVSLTQGGTVTVSGSYPSFTITGADTNIAEGTRTTTTVPITSSTGTGATLSAATTSLAGVMTSADKTKLDGIAAGAQVNVATDLSYTASTRLLASSTGTDATLPLFSSTDAGLVSGSGGGTTNFLRADGTWALPPGGGATPDPLQLSANSASTPTYSFTTATDMGMYAPSTTSIGWSVGGVQRMLLDTDGGLDLFGSAANSPNLTLENSGTTTETSRVVAKKIRGTGATVNGDVILDVLSQGYDGSAYQNSASIKFSVDGTPTAGFVPSRLAFFTSNNTTQLIERLRITSLGSWGLGGANYGIEGDVLMSNGTSLGPSWGGAEYWMAQNAAYTLTSTPSAQKIFNGTTNGALTLPVGTYEYEGLFYISSMSGTSGNAAFNLLGAGTATISSALSQALGQDATPSNGAAQGGSYWTGNLSASPIVTAATNTAMAVSIRGWFRVSVAGTIIPSIALTTSTTAIVQPNSYMVFKRRDASATATEFGPWS